jgi:NADPH:quinone reductase-like Zn-dependent oxidoreductase
MSRKIVFNRTGPAEVLEIIDVDAPIPAKGEVRIRVKAIGLNRAEVNYRAGTYDPPSAFPAQLGFEASGTIDAIGPDVMGFSLGDPVSVIPTFTPGQYGLYGELVLAPARSVVNIPTSLSWAEAAGTWMQFAAAWSGLVDLAQLASKDWVAITAASSSVGLAAIQLARRLGALPIAITRHRSKAEELLRAGALDVIVTDDSPVDERIRLITDGKGARVVFDSVGGPDFAKLVAGCADGGTVLIYGALSRQSNSFTAIDAIRKGLTIRGFAANSGFADQPRLDRFKRDILAGIDSREFRPLIDKEYRFDEVVEAHRYIETGDQFGKVVLRI